MAKDFLQPKKRGRPRSGVGTPVQVRLNPEQLKFLDDWILKKAGGKATRPAAIRELLMMALMQSCQGRPRGE
jgi:hypothetical protein